MIAIWIGRIELCFLFYYRSNIDPSQKLFYPVLVQGSYENDMLPIEPNDQDCLEEDLPNVEVIDYYLDIVEI